MKAHSITLAIFGVAAMIAILLTLVLSRDAGAATIQPTGNLTIVVIQRDWLGNENGVGGDVPINVYNRFGVLAAQGFTTPQSTYTFELPFDTYVIYALYDLRYSGFFGNDCFVPRYTLDETHEYLLITCQQTLYLRLPWAQP